MKKYSVLVLAGCFAVGVALTYTLHESASVPPVATQAAERCVTRPARDVEDLPDGGKRVISSWVDCEGEAPRVGISTVYSREEWKSLAKPTKAGEIQATTEKN